MEARQGMRQARLLDARSRRALLRASQRVEPTGECREGSCAQPAQEREVA
ncbi:hypothetical protein [Halostreptopolyspora alba]